MRRSHTSRNMGKNMLVLPYKTVIPVVPSAGTVVETQKYYDRRSMLEVVPSAGTVVETCRDKT